ncbi:MAG TPA: hypothetical protein V6D13_16960 [Halomicronema sp.]
MKPNFDEMSREELKAYVLSHREDDEALRALCNRPSSNTEKIVFSPPKTQQEEQEQFELFKQIIEKKANKSS